MFKRMKDALGVGSAKVDAHLDSTTVQPGGRLHGRVQVVGGEREQDLAGLRLAFECVAERETDDGEHEVRKQFGQAEFPDARQIGVGEQRALPFEIAVPWDCPPNLVGGTALPKIRLGLRTRLDIAGGRDSSDLDAVTVTALPAQEATLRALSGLGFTLRHADLEDGNAHAAHLRGSLGVYAEYEFAGRGRIQEVEVTFVTTQQECGVLLEIDKRGRFGFSGADRLLSFAVPTASDDVDGIAAHLRTLLA